MSFLIDTNVVSEARKIAGNAGVARWMSATPPSERHISALTVGEIARGIVRLRRRNDGEQARVYESWLLDVVEQFGPRIIPITVDIAMGWGEQDPRRPSSIVDGLIGATAKVRGWTLVTRNTSDFEHLGVPLVNPFSEETSP